MTLPWKSGIAGLSNRMPDLCLQFPGSLAYRVCIRLAGLGAADDRTGPRCVWDCVVATRLWGVPIPMISPHGNAVYNSPIAEMLIPSTPCSSRSCSLLIVLCFCWTSASYATDWTAPARELARKIAAITGPAAVAINLVNRSSLAKEEIDQIDRDLRLQVEAVGVHAVKPD